MNVQQELVSYVIQKQDIKEVLKRRVEPSFLTDMTVQPVFQGVMDFYTKYKQLPTIEWVEQEYPDFRVVYAKQPVAYYIDELMKSYALKEAQNLMIEKANGLYADPFRTIEEIRARLTALSMQSQPTSDVDATENTDERWEDYQYRKTVGGMDGYSTPWATLNDATWGIHDGEFWVIAARPAVGKTFELLVLADWLYTQESKNIVIISNEMHDKQLLRRFDAVHFKLPYSPFRSGLLTMAQEAQYKKGLERMKQAGHKIRVIAGQGMGVNAIGQKIEEHKPDIIMIDGFYLTPDDEKGRDVWSRTTNVSRGLKQLALHYNIPVIGTTQFNRGVSDKSEEAELGNIGFADAIGQDADVVVGLIKTKDMKLNNELQMSVMKSREGDTPTFRHEFDLTKMSFADLNEVIKERYEDEEDEPLDY